jgi:hypothetical protein
MKKEKIIKNPTLTITPFANESESFEVDGLTIENRIDRISIYGEMDITLDEAGRSNALILFNNLSAILNIMDYRKEQGLLPAKIELAEPVEVVNPFGMPA